MLPNTQGVYPRIYLTSAGLICETTEFKSPVIGREIKTII